MIHQEIARWEDDEFFKDICIYRSIRWYVWKFGQAIWDDCRNNCGDQSDDGLRLSSDWASYCNAGRPSFGERTPVCRKTPGRIGTKAKKRTWAKTPGKIWPEAEEDVLKGYSCSIIFLTAVEFIVSGMSLRWDETSLFLLIQSRKLPNDANIHWIQVRVHYFNHKRHFSILNGVQKMEQDFTKS